MPLAREVGYWEDVARHCVGDIGLSDNVWKRTPQVKRLLAYNWQDEKVLEIGTGNGMVAGALQTVVQAHWKYLGTELSEHFRNHAKKTFGLKTVEADVRELPGEGYTRIIAFDSLEHVRPEHRLEGYARIYAVAAPNSLLFIHYSRSPSYHEKEFDHPFGLEDLLALEGAGFTLNTLDRYACFNGRTGGDLDYVFVVMQK